MGAQGGERPRQVLGRHAEPGGEDPLLHPDVDDSRAALGLVGADKPVGEPVHPGPQLLVLQLLDRLPVGMRQLVDDCRHEAGVTPHGRPDVLGRNHDKP